MSECTWVGCEAPAAHIQYDRDGCMWANLCARHAKEFHDAVDGDNVKVICSVWVKAQGGARAAMERM